MKMADPRRRRWFVLDDRSVAIIGTLLMTLSFILMVIAFFGPVWIEKVISTAPRSTLMPKPSSNVTVTVTPPTNVSLDYRTSANMTVRLDRVTSPEKESPENVTSLTTETPDRVTSLTTETPDRVTSPHVNETLDRVTSAHVTDNSTAEDDEVAYIKENLWYICDKKRGCLSRTESSHKGTTSAVWLMTFSILFLAHAMFFALGFWYKLCRPKKFRWAMNISSAVCGFVSGICTLGAVLGFVVYRYQAAADELVLSISFGWSFVIAVLKLPPVFVASTIFILGHRTPQPDKKQESENQDATPLNTDLA